MGVQSSSKKWVLIGVGAIAAAALVVVFQNYPPQPTDSTGAIGAAKRYHEPQITGADVKVDQTELDAVLQSDTFDRIVKDPKARKLFANEAVLSAFYDDATRRTLILYGGDSVKVGPRFDVANDGVKVEPRFNVANEGVKNLTGHPIADEGVKNVAAGDANVLKSGDANVLKSGDANVLKSGDANLLKSGDANVLKSGDANLLKAGDANLLKAGDANLLKAGDAAKTLSVADAAIFRAVLGNSALVQALNDPSFCKAVANPGLRNGLVSEARKLDAPERAD